MIRKMVLTYSQLLVNLEPLYLKPPKVDLSRDLVSERYVLHSSVLSHKNHS